MRLTVENGAFGYDATGLLFENLQFTLEKGEIFTILGPNGSGKTTLLKCITGMLKWKKGKTFLGEKELETIPKKDLWKKISYVPQVHKTVFSYSVMDMVLMGRAPFIGLFSHPSPKDRAVVQNILEHIGISHLARKPCSQISGGEMQLVLVARAMASDPAIVILDEPESHLDFKNQLLVLELVEKLARKKGITCIINTHFPGHALQISDKTLMLGSHNGHVMGKAKEVITEKHIEKIFRVRSKILLFKDRGREKTAIVPLGLPNGEQTGPPKPTLKGNETC